MYIWLGIHLDRSTLSREKIRI